MKRWAGLVCALGACGDGGAGPADVVGPVDVQVEAWQNDPLCPSQHPAMETSFGGPAGCSPGLECRFAAAGCEPGVLPDTICRCGADGWGCEGWARSCFPVGEVDSRPRDGLRPRPVGRPTADACSDPADEPRDVACFVETEGPGECERSAECAADEVCLGGSIGGYEGRCACFAAGCLADDDCGSGEVCACGAMGVGGAMCAEPYVERPCAHACVPAGCRTDADCGPTGFCSASFDPCGTRVERYVCRDATRDECLGDAECAYSADGWACRAGEDDTWRCTERIGCEQTP